MKGRGREGCNTVVMKEDGLILCRIDQFGQGSEDQCLIMSKRSITYVRKGDVVLSML